MTQRNPMNPRTRARQNGERSGSTRKSAAKAKPRSQAASSVYIASTKKSSGHSKRDKLTRQRQRAEEDRERKRSQIMGAKILEMPEYKKWRRIWWIAIAVGIVAVLISWVITSNDSETSLGPVRVIGIVCLFVGYGAILFALWIDLGKIRKMRREAQERAQHLSKAERRRLDAILDAQDELEKKEAASAAQKRSSGLHLFKKKKSAPAGDGAKAGEDKESGA